MSSAENIVETKEQKALAAFRAAAGGDFEDFYVDKNSPDPVEVPRKSKVVIKPPRLPPSRKGNNDASPSATPTQIKKRKANKLPDVGSPAHIASEKPKVIQKRKQDSDFPDGAAKEAKKAKKTKEDILAQLPHTRPWNCAERLCTTGHTFLDVNKNARKCVSEFFGRNKTQTKSIPSQVWHLSCRKSYQKARYREANRGGPYLKLWRLDHIKHQLLRLRLWRPEATFKIQLMAPARTRLLKWYKILRTNGHDRAKAEADVKVTVPKGKKKELDESDSVTMEHAEMIENEWAGNHRTYDDIAGFLQWVEGNIDAMDLLPPFECLINEVQPGEIADDPNANWKQWCNAVDGRESSDSQGESGDAVDH